MYTSDDERHENEYRNEMNTGMKLNAALMEMYKTKCLNEKSMHKYMQFKATKKK